MVRRRASSPSLLALAAAAAGLAGCGEDPRALVDAMGRAYRAADHYADDARVRVVRTHGDSTTEETHPFRVAFQRPDRLRVEAYDARIMADGRRLRAAVGGIAGQVLAEDVQSPLALDQVFADRELRAALTEGEAGCPTQLPLLLADDTVGLILGDASGPPLLLGTETIDGHACGRIAVAKPDGTLELWIDRRTKLLRRMKVPTDAYADLLSGQSGAVTGVSVVVDFVGASFSAPVPAAAFTFEMPAGANEVPRLEPLTAPRPVSPLVGRRAEAFVVAGIDGRAVDREALAGGPAVIEFFFTGCEAAGRSMPLVAAGIDRFRAARREAGRPAIDVRHLSVSLDEADVGVDELRKQLAEYGGVGTLARDPRAAAAETLGVRECPAAVILGADGTVADVIVGGHERIAADVAATLAALADGDDAIRLVRDRHATRLREYTARLTRAVGEERRDPEPRPAAVIAPRRQPLRFKLARAWRAAAVSLPGNLVCLDEARAAASAPRVVVLDGWRDVVELDAGGAEAGRHRLAIPEGAAVRFLRTAVDAAGRRWWLGGSRGGRQVFVFDADWRLHATWPPDAAAGHDGVSAADLLDVDGDGAPEIVTAHAPQGGVEATTLDGRRLWTAPAAGMVIDLAAGPAAAGLWCVGGDGRIVPVSPAGRADMPATAGGWRLRSLASGPVAADGGWAALGIAGTAAGDNVAVGIAANRSAAWELPLARGDQREAAIEPIAWSDLLGTPRRQWLIAAPDGGVTVAWADGRVVDTYHHGAAITGIGGYRHAGNGFVVLATRTAVEAFRVEDVALD